MAELHEGYAKKLVQIFLAEYNKQNKTSFLWIEDKSYLPKDKPYFDFVVFDKDKELGIQHTFAVADSEREFARPNAASKVVNPLRKVLEENPRVPSLSLHLNFHNPPRKSEDIKEAIYWLEFFVTQKVSHPIGLSYFDYDSSFDDEYLPRIKKYIDDITIRPLLQLTNEKHISIGYGWSKRIPEPWLDDAQRVSMAIDKKEKDCKDVLLLIEVGTPSVPFYVERMKEYSKTKDMKEIWIAEPFLGKEKAERIK
jgi:hypothetical protein